MTTLDQKIKILHLEDQECDAELVVRILQKGNLHFDIQVVDSETAFTNALGEYKPDIILSDHSLPQFNSVQALGILRTTGLKIPFIMVTGAVSEDFAISALRTGVDDYILKDRLQRLPVVIVKLLEKYRLERARNLSESLLQNINANSLDMICSIDSEGKFIHVSDASWNVLGYPPSELVGRKYIDLVLIDDVDITLKMAKGIRSGTAINLFENRYIRKDGAVVPMLWSACWGSAEKVMYCVGKNVTEKKKAEKIIASEGKLLRDLFINAPVSICIFKGPSHIFELANAQYLKLIGKNDIVGKSIVDVVPEIKGQRFVELLENVYQTGIPYSENEMLVKIDLEQTGSLTDTYLDFLYQPDFDFDGTVKGIFFFGINVTDQVLTRRKIEERKRQYAQLVQNLPTAVCTCDEEGFIVLFNKAAVELWGRKPIIGKDKWCGALKIYNIDNHLLSLRDYPLTKAVREGISISSEEIIIERPDGSLRHVITHPSPIFDSSGCVSGGINMLIDITENKKIEAENIKLAFVANLTVNAVIATDCTGRITWVNKGFERITDYTAEEVMGKKPGNLLQGPKSDLQTIAMMHESLLNAKGFRGEILNYSKYGREYWLDIEVMPLHDKDNRLSGFMAIEQDITERKTSELETLSLIENLQSKNKELHQFSYIVSHNLRSPIVTILGITNIIEVDNPESKFLIEKIAQEAGRLDDVIKDINTIVSARKSGYSMEQFNFETQIELILHAFESEINQSGAMVCTDFSDVPEILTVKGYLYSILFNLVSNAFKYKSATVNLRIHIRSWQDKNFIYLSVKDNGLGIDLCLHGGKLFGLYKRFHGDSIPGRGIGLNLVKTHIETLGGKIEVESIVNEGTIFKIYLPKKHESNTPK